MLYGKPDTKDEALVRIRDLPVDPDSARVGIAGGNASMQRVEDYGAANESGFRGHLHSSLMQSESRLGLAKKDYYPGFTLGAQYGFRQGENRLPRGTPRHSLVLSCGEEQ